MQGSLRRHQRVAQQREAATTRILDVDLIDLRSIVADDYVQTLATPCGAHRCSER